MNIISWPDSQSGRKADSCMDFSSLCLPMEGVIGAKENNAKRTIEDLRKRNKLLVYF